MAIERIDKRPSARMKVTEIAARLALDETTIYRMLEARQIPAIRSGRLWIVTRAAFEIWERTCGQSNMMAS